MTSPANNTSAVCVSEDEAFKYYCYTVTYLMLFPVALLSNTLALVVFFQQNYRRSSASCVIMTNLALSDAGFALTLPLRLVYYFRGGVWGLPDWLCRLCVYCFYLNLYTSILFLTLLSMLRWLAVLRPLQHRTLATPTRSLLACLAVWLFVGGASVPFLFQGVRVRSGVPRCFEPGSMASWGRVLVLNYVGLVLGFLLPFLVIVGCYGSIARRLVLPRGGSLRDNGLRDNGLRDNGGERQPSASAGEARRRRGRQRPVRLIAMVTATFLLCFLPYHAARALHLHAVVAGWRCGAVVALQRTVVLTLCLAAWNSAVNPLLYYYSTAHFRHGLRRLSTRGSTTTVH